MASLLSAWVWCAALGVSVAWCILSREPMLWEYMGCVCILCAGEVALDTLSVAEQRSHPLGCVQCVCVCVCMLGVLVCVCVWEGRGGTWGRGCMAFHWGDSAWKHDCSFVSSCLPICVNSAGMCVFVFGSADARSQILSWCKFGGAKPISPSWEPAQPKVEQGAVCMLGGDHGPGLLVEDAFPVPITEEERVQCWDQGTLKPETSSCP